MQKQVHQQSLAWVTIEHCQMQYILEVIAGNQELILSLVQAQVLEMQCAFLPTMLLADQSLDVSNKGYFLDEEDKEEQTFFPQEEPKPESNGGEDLE